jgi:voltage-gated potassium channel
VTGTRSDERDTQHAERWRLLRMLDRMLDRPLIALSFVWLALLLAELAVGTDARLDVLFYFLWVVFIAEVAIDLIIAPDRSAYLRANWLKVIALLLPALRALRAITALRFLRAATTVRSASMLRLLTALNRGMGALGRTLDRTRFGYAVALTVLVVFVGAAGMLFFERPAAQAVAAAGGSVMTTYGDALWWTAMAMTTVGTDYFPVTAEGRLLGWLLSVFALGVFGYVTATMASHFLGLGREDESPHDAVVAREIAQLRREIALLSQRLHDRTT